MLFYAVLRVSPLLVSQVSFLRSDFKTAVLFGTRCRSVVTPLEECNSRVVRLGMYRDVQAGSSYLGVQGGIYTRGIPSSLPTWVYTPSLPPWVHFSSPGYTLGAPLFSWVYPWVSLLLLYPGGVPPAVIPWWCPSCRYNLWVSLLPV